jgi:hypothetical protein
MVTTVTERIEEIKIFDVHRRIREALDKLEQEFRDYKIDEIDVGIELGFPSGVKGSLSTKLTKK